MTLRQGEYVRARTLGEEGLAFSRKHDDLGGSLYALLCLEEVCFLQGELAHASSLAEECLLLCTGERRVDKSTVLYRLGQIVLEQGDMVRARTLAEEGLALFKEAGDPSGTCSSLCLVGKVEARQGNYLRAWTCYEQSVRIACEKGFQWDLACGLEGLAGVVAMQGESAWATRLWGMAAALREDMGAPLPPIERAGYDRARTMVRARLGEQGFASAWAQGQAMAPEQALAALTAGMPLDRLGQPLHHE